MEWAITKGAAAARAGLGPCQVNRGFALPLGPVSDQTQKQTTAGKDGKEKKEETGYSGAMKCEGESVGYAGKAHRMSLRGQRISGQPCKEEDSQGSNSKTSAVRKPKGYGLICAKAQFQARLREKPRDPRSRRKRKWGRIKRRKAGRTDGKHRKHIS